MMSGETAVPTAGVADLQFAALAEARRIMKQAKGDCAAATTLVYQELERRGLISADERKTLTKMHDVGSGTSRKADTATTSTFFQVRTWYAEMLARGDCSPVALVLAAGVAGSYQPTQSPSGGTVVFAKSTHNYQSLLAGAGAIIGSGFGPLGGAIGGAVGGVVGTIVDDCKD